MGFPLCFVIAIVARGFIKQINQDFPEGFPASDSKGRIYLDPPANPVGPQEEPSTEPSTVS